MSCTGCDLYQYATQTVFGEGPQTAGIIFVGEQPGDQEDLQGHPFVGPAGRMLDKALEEAGITRRQTYVTNAVKHFKWEPQGKRRKHKRPSAAEMAACRPWLAAEVDLIRPKILVCLGVTAAQSVFRRTVRLGEERGKFYKTELTPEVFITIHPSSLLRHPTREQQEEEYRRFVSDLRLVHRKLHEHS
jgi:uracil-DNA glycosylase